MYVGVLTQPTRQPVSYLKQTRAPVRVRKPYQVTYQACTSTTRVQHEPTKPVSFCFHTSQYQQCYTAVVAHQFKGILVNGEWAVYRCEVTWYVRTYQVPLPVRSLKQYLVPGSQQSIYCSYSINVITHTRTNEVPLYQVYCTRRFAPRAA